MEDEVAAAEAELAGVEVAMQRALDGTYGTCESCGGPIAADRLAASPVVRTCAEHD